MARDAKYQIWKITINGVKYAWRGPKDLYDGVEAACGVKKAGDNEKNLVFGANMPKPPRLRFNLANGKSKLLRVDPSKVESLMRGDANNRKVGRTNLNSVTSIGR